MVGCCGINFTSPVLAEKEHRNTNEYRKFRCQLLHSSLERIFKSLDHAMKNPICVKCPDGKYRRAIFGFGPYIADYPEQCQLASVVQGWCTKFVGFFSSFLAFLTSGVPGACPSQPILINLHCRSPRAI